MLPATVTISAMLADAATTVSNFGTLIVLVAGLSFGVFGVRFLISAVKRAK